MFVLAYGIWIYLHMQLYTYVCLSSHMMAGRAGTVTVAEDQRCLEQNCLRQGLLEQPHGFHFWARPL